MTEKGQNGIQCSQFEGLLPDALDGLLSKEASQGFEAHAAECQVCGPMLAEARQGMAWLQNLEELEPPRNLVHNILAATSASPAQQPQTAPKAMKPGWIARGWKPVRGVLAGMMQPRFATSFSMAFFSLSLTLTLAGVKLTDLIHMDWHPSAVGRAIVMEYTQLESKVVRYYRNMRLVYEIESRVQELKNTSPAPSDQQQPPAEQPKEDKNKKDKNDTSGRPEERQDHYSQELDNALVADLKMSNEGVQP
ncbi:MAG TPA: zf-HC2 domain-containing protein [Candidatus Angelobacter sp.]